MDFGLGDGVHHQGSRLVDRERRCVVVHCVIGTVVPSLSVGEVEVAEAWIHVGDWVAPSAKREIPQGDEAVLRHPRSARSLVVRIWDNVVPWSVYGPGARAISQVVEVDGIARNRHSEVDVLQRAVVIARTHLGAVPPTCR